MGISELKTTCQGLTANEDYLPGAVSGAVFGCGLFVGEIACKPARSQELLR